MIMNEQTDEQTNQQAKPTETQKTWLDIEKENLDTTGFTGEILPSLKLETGKITTFTVDFSEPFGKWTDGTVIKKIVPVMHKDERKNLWLNVKNPLYKEIVRRGSSGQTTFKVSTTGSQAETRYTIVEEE